MTDQIEEQYRRLIGLMDELATLLDERGQDRWADWARSDLARVRGRDAYGLEHFLSGNRGFADAVHAGEGRDDLSQVYSEAYALAAALWRDFQR
jgi:hypothetical protein